MRPATLTAAAARMSSKTTHTAPFGDGRRQGVHRVWVHDRRARVVRPSEPRGTLTPCLKDSVRVARRHDGSSMRKDSLVTTRSREIRLAARPRGAPVPTDFELAEVELPDPATARSLVRNAFVSVDPYMRGRMNDVKSYVPPFELGEPLTGGAVGQVVESRQRALAGGHAGSSTASAGARRPSPTGAGCGAVDPTLAPVSTSLGVLGMPGLTAFVGHRRHRRGARGRDGLRLGRGRRGRQRRRAARVAARRSRRSGAPGRAEKVAWLDELGFDGAFDYQQTPTRDALRELAPDGIDVYFDNVGGETPRGGDRRDATAAAASSPAARSRRYNATEAQPGPAQPVHGRDEAPADAGIHRVRPRRPAARRSSRRSAPLRRGTGRSATARRSSTGIENAPEAFIGLLEGENIGKMLVRVGPEP